MTIFRLIQKQPYRRCSERKGVLRNFAKLTGKDLYKSLFYNKVAGEVCNFIIKETLAQCFPVNFAKFLRTPFVQNTSGRLILLVPIQTELIPHSSFIFVTFEANAS